MQSFRSQPVTVMVTWHELWQVTHDVLYCTPALGLLQSVQEQKYVQSTLQGDTIDDLPDVSARVAVWAAAKLVRAWNSCVGMAQVISNVYFLYAFLLIISAIPLSTSPPPWAKSSTPIHPNHVTFAYYYYRVRSGIGPRGHHIVWRREGCCDWAYFQRRVLGAITSF